MALKRRSDGKMWKDFVKIYLVVIISGLMYLMLFATCEPVCYTRIPLDKHNRHIKRVDCDGTDKICWRFSSRKGVKVPELLHSPCVYPEDYPVTHENEAIICSTTNLPTVVNGSFDCAINSNVSKGESCSLTCNNELYPAYSNKAVCEAGTSNQGGVWSSGGFVCQRLECNGWNQWNGRKYKLTGTSNTWEESRQWCESSNSHLATIENKEENEFLHKIVTHCNGRSVIWIGLNDIDEEGKWKWIDGTVSPYKNWDKGEPDGTDASDCVYMSEGNGEWSDSQCTYRRWAICEKNNPLI